MEEQFPVPRNHAASKIGNGVISLLWQLRWHCNPDHNKISSSSNTTVVSLFPNLCLWRLSWRSNVGGIDPEKLYRATLTWCILNQYSYFFDKHVKHVSTNSLPWLACVPVIYGKIKDSYNYNDSNNNNNNDNNNNNIRKSNDCRFKKVCMGALSMIFGHFGWHIIKAWKTANFEIWLMSILAFSSKRSTRAQGAQNHNSLLEALL